FFTSADSFPLLAVPFFVLAGNIMIQGGISQRLVNFSSKMFGGVTGSLGMITVFTCMIFAAISGSGIATVAAIGGIMIPAMAKENYDKGFATSLAAASGSLGPIIPPSINLIIYGVAAGVSITDLFLAGIVPGMLMAAALMLFVYINAKRYKYGIIREKASLKEKWEAFNEAKWALLIPVIILGGIYGGIFTPTEAAIISSDYGIIVGMFVYKEIKVKDLIKIFKNTAMTVGSICIILGGAAALGKILAIEMIPKMMAESITGFSTNKIILLLLINILLFITGMFMDTAPSIIILTPLLLPIAESIGVDPVHFGLIMVFNLVIGMCTPPVGVNTFVACKISNMKIEETFRWLFPMIGVLVCVLLIITFFPQISMFLPNLR
ncbi:MAG: TRAP transporter large permease, partial [Clostridia bacterium]|nr:TRAP transporter large permease [Clostridia bacterium]